MSQFVCPWWLGYTLIVPVRRWWQDPAAILAPYVAEGMTVLEPGPGMGFFTLELARRVGSRGRVVAVDVQPRMLAALGRRLKRAGLADRVERRLAAPEGMGVEDLRGAVDFVLAFAVVHEMKDAARFLAEAHAALRPGGRMLLSEPAGHVSGKAFEATVSLGREAGFAEAGRPAIRSSRSVILTRP